MDCNLVTNVLTLSTTLSASDAQSFRDQLKAALEEAREPEGIVYVWRTVRDIPRLKSGSTVIYIGKAKYSLYHRYIQHIDWEATNYWNRYHHIIENFGPISIDIYETTNPAATENKFLYQYQMQCFERPPINIQAYKTSLPTTDDPNEKAVDETPE